MEHQHHHQHDENHHTHSHDQAIEDPIQSEQLHLIKVITAFAYYKRHSLNHNHRRRRDYLSLSEHHKKLIPDYLDKVNQIDGRIEENMKLIRAIVKSASMFTEDTDEQEQDSKVIL
jgi:carnosine N-methyltransferase